MFTRSAPTLTLTDLADRLDTGAESISVPTAEIAVDHPSSTIRVGNREIALTTDSELALGGWVDFPAPFMKRLDPDLRYAWLNTLLSRHRGEAVVRLTDQGILAVHETNAVSIDPRRIVEVAGRAIASNADVIDFEVTPAAFSLDVAAPKGLMDRGDKKVGDITRGGVRFFHNRSQNLAPKVSPYMYRLLCTNGMETRSDGLKIDARGQTVDEVLAELEVAAQRAFAQVEQDIEHFYALRDQPVDNPERQLIRYAREQGISDRLRVNLVDTLPAALDEHGEMTMFDIVNHVTNLANDPTIRRRGVRLELERFGGSVVHSAHDERCRVCSSRLN